MIAAAGPRVNAFAHCRTMDRCPVLIPPTRSTGARRCRATRCAPRRSPTPSSSRTGAAGPWPSLSTRAPLTVLRGRTGEVEPLPMKDDEGGGRVAFVAVDLLRVAGQTLLDLPLLERKRLLDTLIRQRDLVRVSPYTRPPLRPWILSWKSLGFDGAVVKAANSRYVPSTVTEEWTVVTKLSSL